MTPTSDRDFPTRPQDDSWASERGRSDSSAGSDRSLIERLFDEFKHLPQFVVNTYFRHIPDHVDRADMVQDAYFALIDWLVSSQGGNTERNACAVMRRAVYAGLRRMDSRDMYIPEGYEASEYGDPRLTEDIVQIDAIFNERTLSEEEKWAIRLHYLEGMKQNEVAEAMGVSKNKVKWIIQQSLDKLRSGS